MSVLASLRGETGVDYVDNAIKLSGFTKNTCKKIIPKGYTFYGGTQICDTAIRVASHAIQANSIYAMNKAEARLRKEQLLLARAALKDLVAQVASMFEAIHFEMKILEEWSMYIDREFSLLSGVLDSDAKRAKSLPD